MGLLHTFNGIVKDIFPKIGRDIYPTVYVQYGTGDCRFSWGYGDYELPVMDTFAEYDTLTSPYEGSSYCIVLGYVDGDQTIVVHLQRVSYPYNSGYLTFYDASSGDPNLHICYLSSNYAVISYLNNEDSTTFRKIYFDSNGISEITDGTFPLVRSSTIVQGMAVYNGEVWFAYKTASVSLTYMSAVGSPANYAMIYYTYANCHKMLYVSDPNYGSVLSLYDQVGGFRVIFQPNGGGQVWQSYTGAVDWVQTMDNKIVYVRMYDARVYVMDIRASNEDSRRSVSIPHESEKPRLFYSSDYDRTFVGCGNVLSQVNLEEEDDTMELNSSLMVTTYGKRSR